MANIIVRHTQLVLRSHQDFSGDLIQKAAPQKWGMTGSNPLLSPPVCIWVGAVGADVRLTGLFAMANIRDTNYCPDAQYFNHACCQTLVNYSSLTQRSSFIGRLQVERCVSLFVQAYYVTYLQFVMMKLFCNLSLYSLDSDNSTSCIGRSQSKNAHAT